DLEVSETKRTGVVSDTAGVVTVATVATVERTILLWPANASGIGSVSVAALMPAIAAIRMERGDRGIRIGPCSEFLLTPHIVRLARIFLNSEQGPNSAWFFLTTRAAGWRRPTRPPPSRVVRA